jgi:S-adenosylmethionine/arginine decarboxylase-like enzyme
MSVVPLGTNFLITVSHVLNLNALNLVEHGMAISNQLIQDCNFHSVRNTHYQFNSSGYSLVNILVEGHIIIHTYPEINKCLIDILTCETYVDSNNVINFLKTNFDTDHITYHIIRY